MAIVDLDLFKLHCRADDFTDDDAELEHVLQVAESSVIEATRRTKEELYAMGGGEFPIKLKHAIMMWGAHLYAHPEGVDTLQLREVPYTLSAMIKPYRKLVD